MGWLDQNIPGYKQVSGAIDTGYKKSGLEGVATWAGDLLTGSGPQQLASPEQRAQWDKYLKSMGGRISDATMAAKGNQSTAIGSLDAVNNPMLGRLGTFNAQAGQIGSLPTAQTQFNIGGATQYGPDGRPIAPSFQQVAYNRPGELGSALTGFQNFGVGQGVTDAQQQLNATYGNLGQFVQGAGSGQSQATLAASAAMDKQQEIAMQNALGQLKEKGFAGGATSGGMGNLAAMAAAQSAGDFARQKAGLLENERQAALQAMGLQGQLSGTLGNIGLGASGQQLQALSSMGALAQGEAGQQLQASMANQDAAAKAAALAQAGDIAGAQLALQGTGMNMEQAFNIAQANQGANLQAQGLNLQALTSGAGITADQQRAIANLQAQTPEMQALQAYLGFGSQLRPEMTPGKTGLIDTFAGKFVEGAATGLGEKAVS